MKTIIILQNRPIPVFYNPSSKKLLPQLISILENKLVHGKRLIRQCLDSLISIEIDGCEAILHTKRESDTLALSIY